MTQQGGPVIEKQFLIREEGKEFGVNKDTRKVREFTIFIELGKSWLHDLNGKRLGATGEGKGGHI